MSGNEHPIEWYLARDAQQFGPLSDAELRKFIELGHLRPNDLLWRHGFPDWRPASLVFPSTQGAPQGVPEGEVLTVRTSEPSQSGSSAKAASAANGVVEKTTSPRASTAAPKPMTAGRTEPRGSSVEGHRRETMPRAVRPGSEPSTPSTDPEPRRRFPWVTSILLLLAVGLTGGAFALHQTGYLSPLIEQLGLTQVVDQLDRDGLASLIPKTMTDAPAAVRESPKEKGASPETGQTSKETTASVGRPVEGVVPALKIRKGMERSPFSGFGGTAEAVDAGFQNVALWQVLKREFPDWYSGQVNEAVRLSAEQKDDKAIAQHLVEALVALRRKHVTEALAASPQQLRLIATTFLENLGRLAAHSIDACYGFISQGETSPAIVELMRSSEHVPHLQAQVVAVFDAIAEGRKSPHAYAAPRREDYDALFAKLSSRGWSPADLSLFSDARALSKASPQKVCQMVQDWFAAQLAIEDSNSQIRLLVEALRPVVSG